MREPETSTDDWMWWLANALVALWYAALSWGALWLELAPLPAIRDSVGGTLGTVAAVASGAGIVWLIALLRDWIAARIRRLQRTTRHEDEPEPIEPHGG